MASLDPAHAPTAADPFDLSLPSPLPAPAPTDAVVDDPVARAERDVARADRLGDEAERIATRLALANAWLALDAVGPALEALRGAERASPGRPEVLEHLARVLPRASLLREAAGAWRALAQQRPTPTNLHASACAWLRADDHAEALRALDDLSQAAPDDARTAHLTVTFARLRTSAAAGVSLVARLLDCAALARRRDDRERWREHALDAWIESRGAEGGEQLAEALAATGHPRAAVYVAAESAARALASSPRDVATASRLLVRCARLAESAGLPGEAAAAWIVRALLPDELARDARESLRDILAEQGRSAELAARLRVDARRAAPGVRGAAWKGVAAIEIAHHPTNAAHALAEALRHQPDDAEALDLLASLAGDPAVATATRDALWGLVRDASLDAPARTRFLLWLANLEEHAGDPSSAEAAFAAIDEPIPEAFAGVARVHEDAEALAERADEALRATEAADPSARDAAVEALVSAFAATPGAFRDVRRLAQVLSPSALKDERTAALWLRVARRAADPGLRASALRRLATRALVPGVRARAALEWAEILDESGDTAAAVETLTLLLDEQPGEVSVAAALAALAEHSDDPTFASEAARAVARAASDAWEREFLARFIGETRGIFAVFASSLSDPAPTRERCDDLARLHDLMGDSATLLAHRARALMVQSGPVADALDVSRRFALFAPLSPEATIAWFGAANVAGDSAQIADAAVAVARSLATTRDVSAVARTAISRLEALGALDLARQVALEAAAAIGLAERPLRATVLDLVRRSADARESPALLEHVAACSGALDEQMPALRALAEVYRRHGPASLEIGVLRRLRAQAPEATVPRLLELARRSGDRAGYARLLAGRLDDVRAIADRRALLLELAAEYAAADPPLTSDALDCIDRVAQEQPDAEVQGLAVRALVAIGQPEAALGRLMRWASECLSDDAAAARVLCAARIARDVVREPARAATILRSFLRRCPAHGAALDMAEDLAAASPASIDALLAIYGDLTEAAAGDHARHAIAYRRAVFLERVGRADDALEGQFALFVKHPALGATFTAVERLAERCARYEVLVRALGLLGASAGVPEARARYFLRAAEVARLKARDPALSVMLELLAFQSDRDPTTETAVRQHAQALRAEAPDVSVTALRFLVDDALNLASQAWEDGARHTHALHALELCLGETDDASRAAEAAGLFLKQHEDPTAARRTVRELIECFAPPAEVRAAVNDLDAMQPPALADNTPTNVVPLAELERREMVRHVASTKPTLAPPSLAPAVREPSPPPSVRPPEEAAAAPSRAPTQRPSQRPLSRPPFNPKAAIQAGMPVRTPTPLYTPVGRPSQAPASRPSQRPSPAQHPLLRPPTRPQVFHEPPPPREAPSQRPTEPAVIEHVAADTTPEPPRSPPPEASRDLAKAGLATLRAAAESGDDGAAAALSRHLAQSIDTRDEALMIQRRRFERDPARVDALEALVGMYDALRMRNESGALASVLSVLTGRPLARWPEAPSLNELADPLEGVARVLFPANLGPFPELGALLWESSSAGRRDATRSSPGERTFAPPSGEFGRMFTAAVRLLQVPRATPVMVRTDVPEGVSMAPGTSPPTVLVASTLARDTARMRYLLGSALEATRACHLPVTAFNREDGERYVAAIIAAFGRNSSERLDPAVARLAGGLLDGMAPRTQRRCQDLVEALGARLTYASWRGAVGLARLHAAMLVCGDFRVAAASALDTAPPSVARDPSKAIADYEPLRALARFAASEEYLLLRWQRARPDRW